MISESDILIPEREERESYLNLVVVKIRTALRDELEKNEWKIEIADDQRIIVERLLDVHESLLSTGAEFAPSEIDGISYSDLINADDPDLFGALSAIDHETPELLAAHLVEHETLIEDKKRQTETIKSIECEEKLDEDRPFVCRTCVRAFRRKKTLEAHISKKHSDPDNRLLCNTCGVSFKTKKLLRQHVNTSHDSHSWPCKVRF